MLVIMVISLMMICSSFSYWSMWLGLEMFNFFFIPWLLMEENHYKSSKIFYYFIIQVTGSGMMLISFNNINHIFFYLIFIFSMFVKLGSFPFHSWMIVVVENMDWYKFFFFMTLSKLGSICILFIFGLPSYIMKVSWGGMILPIWGMKLFSLRKMLAYTSIANISWILTSISLSKMMTIYYIVLYWSTFYIVCLFLKKMNIKSLKDLLNSSFSSLKMIAVLSLMGFPPFLGFFPKLMILKMLCMKKMFIESFIISLISVIPFFFYLKMLIMMFWFFHFKNMSFFCLKEKKLNITIYCLLFFFCVEFIVFLNV
uniref:NADH dehydrogenase subunit 2 n=1 Tax=Ciconiphilus decimfasciatus TaxID=2212705 RepID=UPI00257F398E|nr:NADH dehydrogenase subunit 2 [Ciconiphilus decimfasciatus]WGW14989.1 NADH dehydrogenase subunit 2 [Ciconiphilus decimfasciatus]